MKQYEIILVNLDPTVGHEIKKTRPCAVISPNEMNLSLQTIIVAPITSQSRSYPSRVKLNTKSAKGWIVLDQIRTIDRKRIIRSLGMIPKKEIEELKDVLREMLIC